MAEGKSPVKIMLLVVVLLFAAGGVYYAMTMNKAATPDATLEASQTAEIEQAQGATASVVTGAEIDLEQAKVERVLGNPSAPIKITEHASLTCSHCADFHKNTMPELIKNYIDTGKAYLVFSDFPLNAPALHATMASRCVQEDKYFDFIKALFEDQENWAGNADYMNILKQKASDFGLSNEKFDACLKSEPLQNALLERMKAVQGQWSINSTPSFVVNNQVVISGALAYADFDKRVQEALAEIAKKESAPATATPAVTETPAAAVPAPVEAPETPETPEAGAVEGE